MKRFSLTWGDAARGLLIAVLTPVFVIVQQTINAGSLTFDWKAIGIAAVGGLCAYLTKNFFTDSVKTAQNIMAKANQNVKPSAPNDQQIQNQNP